MLGTFESDHPGLQRYFSALHLPFEQPASNRRDAVINNILLELTTEHYEIARYIKLITAATHVGDLVTVKVCEGILEDEEAMAEKLIVELPEITSTYLKLLLLRERRKLVTSHGSEFGQIKALTRFAPRAA